MLTLLTYLIWEVLTEFPIFHLPSTGKKIKLAEFALHLFITFLSNRYFGGVYIARSLYLLYCFYLIYIVYKYTI